MTIFSGHWCCSHSSSQNVLQSSPKITDILEFVLTYATINCWWLNASINLNNLLRQMMLTRPRPTKIMPIPMRPLRLNSTRLMWPTMLLMPLRPMRSMWLMHLMWPTRLMRPLGLIWPSCSMRLFVADAANKGGTADSIDNAETLTTGSFCCPPWESDLTINWKSLFLCNLRAASLTRQ